MSNSSENLDFRLLILVIGAFGAMLVMKNQILLFEFLLQYRYLIAFATASAIVIGLLQIRSVYLRRTEAARLSKMVISAEPCEDAIFAGFKPSGERVYIKHAFRRMHTQVIGTTNAGKTESVIIPWAVDDIKRGRGIIIIDGKSDRSLLDKLYGYASKYNRADDFRILSLCNPEISHTFNPLAGGSPLEITERVFKALTFENEYFKDLQYEALLYSLLILEACKITPTPIRVVELLRSAAHIKDLSLQTEDRQLIDWTADFLRLSREEREQRTSGLISKLQVFTVGATKSVFNHDKSDIDLETALSANHIIYCQLPVLKIPTLGKTTGKLILQALQGAIASRHLSNSAKTQFYSVYLDDFTEYLTEGFVSTLNKSRSAKILVTFAHQALGDLAVLGDDIKNTILTNANLKVFMRTNEPTSAEYFSEVIGTSQSTKITERQTSGMLGAVKTGDGSVRDVEEFKFHPNVFKQDLGTGEAILVIPHGSGSLPIRLKFRKLPDLDSPAIPLVLKTDPVGLPNDNRKQTRSSPNSLLAEVLDERKETA